jgi:signal transduction histidine kinase
MFRTRIVTIVAVALGLASVGVVIELQQRADGRREAQLQLQTTRNALSTYQLVPWKVNAANGGSPSYVLHEMPRQQRAIEEAVAALQRRAPSQDLKDFEVMFARNTRLLVATRTVLLAGSSDIGAAQTRAVGVFRRAEEASAQADADLVEASVAYQHQANAALLEAAIGSALAVLTLVAAFSFFFFRWTRERVTADALAASNERGRKRLHAVIANMPGVVYRMAQTGTDWTVEFLSDHVEVMTGYPTARFADAPVGAFRDMVHPDDRAAVDAAVGKAIAGKEPLVVEYRLLDAAGDIRWVYERAAEPTALSDGTIALDGIIFDVTDRRVAEQERDRMELDLRIAQKLEAVGQLAAGIAHEINTPVQFVGDSVRFLDDSFGDLTTLIAGYRRILVDQQVPTEAIDELEATADLAYLGERIPAVFVRIYDGVERVASLVKAMKSFAHPSQAEGAPADLNEAFRTTLTVARSEYKYVADVKLELAELPPVLCNVGDINQVFLNLVVNAAHAIADDRPPDVGPRGVIVVSSFVVEGGVLFRVSDDGCGIPPEISERIFDPFFTTKEVGRGSGQGLSLSRTIVERHGGLLTCESDPGHGTTFSVFLPSAGAVDQHEELAA